MRVFAGGALGVTELPEADKRYAIVIGISQYAHVANLAVASNDARAVEDVLVTQLHFSPQHVLVLSSDRSAGRLSTTRSAIIESTSRWLRGVPAGSLVVLFFSGYAFEASEDAYLIPSDGLIQEGSDSYFDAELIRDTNISLSELQYQIDRTSPAQVIYLFDACHTIATKNTDPGASHLRSPLGFTAGFVRPRQIETGRPKASLVLNAASPGEVAYVDPTNGHSLFTSALIRGLSGAAYPQNGDEMTLEDLIRYVNFDVAQKSRSFTAEEDQRPTAAVFGYDTQRVVLTTRPPLSENLSFSIAALIHASGKVPVELPPKVFHFSSPVGIGAPGERSAAFCYTDADRIESWKTESLPTAGCPTGVIISGVERPAYKEDNCLSVTYQPGSCTAQASAGDTGIAFNLVMRATRLSQVKLNDFPWSGSISRDDQFRKTIQYVPTDEDRAKFRGEPNVKFSYEVRVQLPGLATKQPTIFLTDAVRELGGIRTSISDSGQLVVDVTGVVQSRSKSP